MKTKQERTQALIDHYKGCPGEWAMLKGVLCIDHALPKADESLNIDLMMIAERMDNLTKEGK